VRPCDLLRIGSRIRDEPSERRGIGATLRGARRYAVHFLRFWGVPFTARVALLNPPLRVPFGLPCWFNFFLMPLINPHPNSPDDATLMAAGCFDRRSLERRSRGLFGQAYTEVRLWCRKTRQWQALPVRSQQSWVGILEPISSPRLSVLPLRQSR
jgi:hypothetical protein